MLPPPASSLAPTCLLPLTHTPPCASLPPSLLFPQDNDEYAAKKQRAKAAPQNMVDELKAAARALEPGVAYPA